MKCADCGCEIDISNGEYRLGEKHELWADCAKALIKRAERAESELAELREQNRWIPVSERLPECDLGQASHYVDVAYNASESGYPLLWRRCQYWKEYGWVIEWRDSKPISFEICGYIVCFWKNPLPLPPAPSEAE